MICLSFTASDRAALEAERYSHPHPKVPRKLEAVYLKSLELPHHLICRICRISKPTLGRYLRAFEHGGLDGLKQLGTPAARTVCTRTRRVWKRTFANIRRPPARRPKR